MIHNLDNAARVLRWDRIHNFPAAQKAVQKYVDDPTTENRAAANASLSDLGPVGNIALGHWVSRAIRRPRRVRR